MSQPRQKSKNTQPAKSVTRSTSFAFLSGKLRRAYSVYSECLETLAKGFTEEAVHDLRVSIRRFIAVVMLAERMVGSPYAAELSQLLRRRIKLFSPLRDVQVQQLEVRRMLFRFPDLSEYARHLEYLEEIYVHSLRSGLADIANDNVFGLVFFLSRDCYQMLGQEELTGSRIRELVIAEFAKVSNAIAESDVANIDSIHAVRLAFKNFRYVSEQFTSLLNIGKRDLRGMNAFQTALGQIQDNRVLYERIRKYSARVSEPNRLKFRFALAELMRRRGKLLDEYTRAASHAGHFVREEFFSEASSSTDEAEFI